MGDFRDISKRLLYYKRKEIQQAIVASAKDREVGVRFGNKGYGKRPDILEYENDVFIFIKKGVTSIHVSEERWNNPLELSTGMNKKTLDELRDGWDLVLDIDCPFWHFSKLTAHLFIKALEEHNIESIGCKFSGNKGFHISVPFEAFPEKVNDVPVKDWFPEGPKRIALYLLDYISNNLIKVQGDNVDFDGVFNTTINEISKISGKEKKELSVTKCLKCKSKLKHTKKRTEFICKNCSYRIIKEDNTKLLVCPKCKILMEKIEHESLCHCGSNDYITLFDPLSIIEVDTILISSRHMYRAPYSLHEKSGLASVVFSHKNIMSFEKDQANPEKIMKTKTFMKTDAKKGEAYKLLIQAFDHQTEQNSITNRSSKELKEYELPDIAIPEDFFPESIKKGLLGLKDGKKRFLFILVNFLRTSGWTNKNVEEKVLEWNKKNPEPLKDNYIVGQLRYSKYKKPSPPPNYSSGYYKDLGIPDSDLIMRKYKNPVVYAKSLYEQRNKRKKKKKVKNENKEKGVQGAKR
ncbi:hypothetical protein HN789_03815 [archaeon]|jgi:DNA-directed RNA polymerase subunit RPC12/RpoP|nr:hypothetical protein [archaeon]MBT4023090.1 hypothetical protein [archaeon]MBT4272488.1 hypothetical protein [archaeon]MBT4460586.1 hypothetical protein [archaeon]MBT4857824.1 hypothetical protein [archaeon]